MWWWWFGADYGGDGYGCGVGGMMNMTNVINTNKCALIKENSYQNKQL